MEDQRRELETRYTSLVKNIRDHSIFTLDPEGRITSWNREAEKILGYTEAEALGQHFSIIFTPEDREAGVPAQELATATSEGRAEDERWHARKGGERFWALGIVTPTQDASGAHTGYSKILRDMTDRKRAEEGLQLADKRKDEFLATLAHELRNPLAPIRNGLHLLRLTTDPATWAQAREMMERQLGQMVRLVDDLLDISRITRNKLELRKAPVELWAVVQNAVETARPQIEASGHTLTVTLPPQPIRRRRGPRTGWPRPHPALACRSLRGERPRPVRASAGEGGLPHRRPEPDGEDRADDDPAATDHPTEHGGGGAAERPPDASLSRAGRGACHPGAARAP